MSDHWSAACEAMHKVAKGREFSELDQSYYDDLLTAALPHLERHFREMLAEELRAEATFRRDITHGNALLVSETVGFCLAADHLEGK